MVYIPVFSLSALIYIASAELYRNIPIYQYMYIVTPYKMVHTNKVFEEITVILVSEVEQNYTVSRICHFF